MSWIDIDSLNITDHQKEQLAIASSGNIGCFTGRAGTGKTHVIGEILRSFKGIVQVMTPTGKSASVVRSFFPDASVSTVHSALQPTRAGHGNGKWSFARNQAYPLDSDLILCDEWSMCGQDIHLDKLNAVRPGTKVLYFGDPFRQLLSVSAGKVMIDMIRAGVPHGELTELHRYAGRIARVCGDIADGKNWTPSTKLDLDAVPKENLIHIESQTPKVPGHLKNFVEQFLAKGFTLEQIQILCPCNTSGDLCRERLNGLLQNWFNPINDDNPEIVGKFDEGKTIKQRFRINDRIMCLSNNWGQKSPMDGETFEEAGSAYCANGDTGLIIGTMQYKGRLYVKCRMPTAVLVYELGEFRSMFTLSYAITVHKSQGSSWPVVIPVIDDSNGARMVADRALWYTGCTRASEICCIVGPRSAMLQQCRTVRINSRKTFLSEEIKRMAPTS